MRPNKLDSIFSAAKHVIIETKARDTFSIVNVDTGTTLIRSAKFLKYGPSKHIGDDIDVCKKQQLRIWELTIKIYWSSI